MATRTTYGNSPAEVFGINADLDQRAIANFLNSIQANRGAQQAAFQAQSQVANQQRNDEQNQLSNALQLLRLKTDADTNAQSRMDYVSRMAEQLGLKRDTLAETLRHNKAVETKENASLVKEKRISDEAKAFAEEQADLAERIAEHKNKALDLRKFMSGLPTAPAIDEVDRARSAVSGYSGPRAMEPLRNIFNGTGRMANERISKNIRESDMPNLTLPPSAMTENDPVKLLALIRSAAATGSTEAEDTAGGDWSDYVELDPRTGRFKSIVNRNTPGAAFTRTGTTRAPLSAATAAIGTQAASPIVAPKVLTDEMAVDLLRKAGGNKIAARALAREQGYAF